MHALDRVGDQVRHYLEEKNATRDRALQRSRTLIRHCANAIRAAHRDERPVASEHLMEAAQLAEALRSELGAYPDLYHAGYTQDALKEYAEANIVCALLGGEELPDPDSLRVEYAAYLCGLGEAAGELRRRVLDLLRQERTREAEGLLGAMDDIYALLVTIDFPDAITGNLRRTTDMVRGVTERTRGDLTTSVQQNELKAALKAVDGKLDRT
jgi:translin